MPDDLKAIVELACQAGNLDMQAEYNYGNAMALQQLKNDPNVEIRPLPDDVLKLLQKLTTEVTDELSARAEWSARIQKSYAAFFDVSAQNQLISEQAYLNARTAFP